MGMTRPDFDRSFRFADEGLQAELLGLVKASGVPHDVTADATLRYPSADTEFIENELICSIRDRLFPEWGIFTLEGDDTSRPDDIRRYRRYMLDHGIPHYEENSNGFIWFLISREHDSYEWDVPTA
jgi:hypothetical protein